MHKYFEKRKRRYDAKARNPRLRSPPTPRTTQDREWKRQEDELQEMVLEKRPIQQPVVSIFVCCPLSRLSAKLITISIYLDLWITIARYSEQNCELRFYYSHCTAY